jgi:phytoene desaturase (3,4-didehydrolycopene-forming)
LLKCEPNYQIFFHDNESFTVSTNLPQMKEAIEQIEGDEGVNGYLRYLEEASHHHSISLEHVLVKNFGSYTAMLRPEVVQNLLLLHPFESIWSRTKRYFKSERLRRVFTFASMYMGMSPFECPGTFSLLQYTELMEGIWYPEGGFHRVVAALEDFSTRHGAKYLLSTDVSRITTSESKRTVTGIELQSGEHIPADIVICNADLVHAYNSLLEPTSYAKNVAKRPQSCSSVSFYWALDRSVPELRVHNIFLAERYKESFDDIFHGVGVPSEPSFYVNVPSRIDPSAAPDGKDSVVVLCPVASMKQNSKDNSINVDELRRHIISTIAARTGVDLKPLIRHEKVHTPHIWKDKFNLFAGSILGLSHSFWNVLSFRPRIRHPSIQGLYFVGASTHPGTGVPVCLAGSGVTSREVLRDLGMDEELLDARPRAASNSGLDQIEESSWLDLILIIAVAIIGIAVSAMAK